MFIQKKLTRFQCLCTLINLRFIENLVAVLILDELGGVLFYEINLFKPLPFSSIYKIMVWVCGG
jgi:hypothetical protein